MSQTKQQSAKVNASKASVKSNASVTKRQPPSNPLDVLTRCGFGSKTEGKRSGLQPIDGDYVPYYDRIYKPSATTAVDTTRPAGISSFPHLRMQQLEEQQAGIINQQNQHHNAAEPKSTEPANQDQQYPAQPTQSPQTSGDCPPPAEPQCGASDNQATGQQPPSTQQTVPDPHEYVTKCPNCAATLVLTPQMIPCSPGHQ